MVGYDEFKGVLTFKRIKGKGLRGKRDERRR